MELSKLDSFCFTIRFLWFIERQEGLGKQAGTASWGISARRYLCAVLPVYGTSSLSLGPSLGLGVVLEVTGRAWVQGASGWCRWAVPGWGRGAGERCWAVLGWAASESTVWATGPACTYLKLWWSLSSLFSVLVSWNCRREVQTKWLHSPPQHRKDCEKGLKIVCFWIYYNSFLGEQLTKKHQWL